MDNVNSFEFVLTPFVLSDCETPAGLAIWRPEVPDGDDWREFSAVHDPQVGLVCVWRRPIFAAGTVLAPTDDEAPG